MRIHSLTPGAGGVGLAAFLAWQALSPAMPLTAQTQDAGAVENGVVYYSVGSVSKPLEKTLPTTDGTFTRSTTIEGEHSSVRLVAGQPYGFRVCGVDPTRYKLYPFRSEWDARTLKIGTINVVTGAVTNVISRSEIPLIVSEADSNCFKLAPREALNAGEFGFNVVDSNTFFMFGVDGDKNVKSVPAQNSIQAQLPDTGGREIGVVYYADGSGHSPLLKEVASSGGRPNYIARVKGAHSAIRLSDGQAHAFVICGVDPTRYKLYTIESSKKERTMLLAKVGFWGAARDVLSASEVPVTIQVMEGKCYAISPKEPLKSGEYGFSPAGANDVFMFGVGAVNPAK